MILKVIQYVLVSRIYWEVEIYTQSFSFIITYDNSSTFNARMIICSFQI